MASSVNRRIETDLSRAMGQCDLAGLIRPRSTEPIRACGLRPRQQAGHMTASDLQLQTRGKLLASRGPSTHGPWAFSPRTLIRGHPRLLYGYCGCVKTWMPGTSPGKGFLEVKFGAKRSHEWLLNFPRTALTGLTGITGKLAHRRDGRRATCCGADLRCPQPNVLSPANRGSAVLCERRGASRPTKRAARF